jgi:hypothetical protein
LYSLLDPGCKMWSIRVLPSGVLDGIIWCSSLSGLLVLSGRQAPRKRAKLGDSATMDMLEYSTIVAMDMEGKTWRTIRKPHGAKMSTHHA